MARGRKPIEVNIVLLQSCINTVEKGDLPSTRSELHDKVAELYNSKTNKPIKPHVVMLRIKDNSVKVKTPVGRPGRQAGQGMPSGINRPGRKRKTEADLKPFRDFVKAWRERHGNIPSLEGTLKRCEKGSVKALIKVKCLDCSGMSRNEVKGCGSFTCALFPVRPYQNVTVKGEEISDEEDAADEIETDTNDLADDDNASELVA